MAVILDASVFVEAERGTFDLSALLETRGDEPVGIAAVTASELLHGVERAADQPTRSRRHQFVERIVTDFPILPFGLAEAREHARLWAGLAGSGALIGAHDMLIAATALTRGAAVATLNLREFSRVPGLTIVPVTPFMLAKVRRPLSPRARPR